MLVGNRPWELPGNYEVYGITNIVLRSNFILS